MAPEAKTSKTKRVKNRAPDDAGKTKAAPIGADEEEAPETMAAAATPTTSKSKCKARPKSRPKSATKVKRPKSRPKLVPKEKMPVKGKDDPTMEEQVLAILEMMAQSKTQAQPKERTPSKTSKVATKGKSSGKNSAAPPETKTKSDRAIKQQKSRTKSRGLACKSSKCSTQKQIEPPTKSSGKVAKPSAAAGRGPSQTTQPSNPTQIIILGTDPQAMELIQSLVAKMNPQAVTKEPAAATPADEQQVTDQSQLEELYDAMFDLTNNVRTIQDSYLKIINSLVNLQKRRKGSKAKASLIPAQAAPEPKTNTGESPAAPAQVAQGNIARFMDPATRNEAFEELFAQVQALKTDMAAFYSCFNENGYFDRAKYDQQPITVAQRDSWLAEIRSMAVVVDALLAEYNREVLDMFRIESNIGN